MTRIPSSRSRLLAPLVYLVALVLLLEEWFWDAGARLADRLAQWPRLRALEERIGRLRPVPALCLFVLPGLLLLPVKLLALVAIAHGHALGGIATIVLVKLGGAALVARIYVLTLPALGSMAWFARWHNWFAATRDDLVGRLRASSAWRRVRRLVDAMRRRRRRAGRTWRILRRFGAQWRARRRQSSGTEHQ
jgi:hypothetical protein